MVMLRAECPSCRTNSLPLTSNCLWNKSPTVRCESCNQYIRSELPLFARVLHNIGYVVVGLILTPLLVVMNWGNPIAYAAILGGLIVSNAAFLSVMHIYTNRKRLETVRPATE